MGRSGGRYQDRHKMKLYRSVLNTMRLVILVCQLGLILRTEAQTPEVCITSSTNRPPENSDIHVVCGTKYMDLSIYLCPVYQSRYNESMLALNNQFNTRECYGVADFNTDPPVLKFRFPLNESAITSCKNNFQITNKVGTGAFADYSNVQYVNISGFISSEDPTQGMITYLSTLLYQFSCLYPMQYLLNNTQLAVSGVNLAIRDNNGSFLSTLSMELYENAAFNKILVIPQTGLDLKTKIYVEVKATNLTGRFNVLLDRCYATADPDPTLTRYYDLFVGCNRDPQTVLDLNGEDQKAQFNFEAFRFLEHKNQTLSVFYLHCVVRLCEVSACASLLPNCNTNSRRRREAHDESINATVTSPQFIVGDKSIGNPQTFSAPLDTQTGNNYSSPVVAVIVCIVILTIVLLAMGAYFAYYIRQRKPFIQ